MNYYKLLTKQGYSGDCFIVDKIYPETFTEGNIKDYYSVKEMSENHSSSWQEVPAGDYFVQEGIMPEYFAIKRVADNPLWEKYIDWWQKQFKGTLYTGVADKYYGFKGRTSDVRNAIINKELPEGCIELTLEQWDKIINKTMEEVFKLPEKWCVLSQGKDTYEKYLQPYLEKYDYENPEWNGIDYYYSYVKGEFYADSYPEIRGCVEITFEQFIKHVLKEESMEENDKEIIGWKLKEDCKKNSKAAFYICTGYTNDNGIYGNVESSYDIEKLKDAGILELWFEPVYIEKTLQFGGYAVTFEKVNSGVRITCNGETGTFSQIEKIYTTVLRKENMMFGNQEVKQVVYSDDTYWLSEYLKAKPTSIKIGCTTGTWKEFVAIYEKAKSML